MNPMNIIALALVAIVVGAAIDALLLLIATVCPGVVRRARGSVEKMPIRSFLIGLINFVFFGLIAAAFLSGRELIQVFGLIVLTVLMSLVVAGLAAVASMLGERLLPDAVRGRQMLAGGLVLELASLVPLVGWIAVPLFAGITGYGAVIVALIRRGPSSEPPSAPVTETPLKQ
jgi:hypothetical protein